MTTGHKINLLLKDDFDNTPLGKFLHWSISTGRWIVVFTDLVVICAFLSRFYFDTKLANLYDEIKQGQTIIEANSAFEKSFRFLQKKVVLVENLLGKKFDVEKQADLISAVLPGDVILTSFSFNKEGLSLSGDAYSEVGMSLFLKNLLSSPQISKVNISDLSIGEKDGKKAIGFSLSADWRSL